MLSQIWIIPALAGTLLWTVVNIFDNFSFSKILNRPSQGLVISSLFSIFGILMVPTWWNIARFDFFLLAILGGILLQASQFFYFACLEEEDISDIVTYGSTYPIIVALFSTLLGDFLSLIQWLGVVIVVMGIIVVEWKRSKNKKKFNKNILGYVLCLSLSSILVDKIFNFIPFTNVVLPYCLGLILGGASPLILKSERLALIKIWPKIQKNILMFGFVELINVLALLCEVLALSLGHPALVNTAASSEPIFILLFAVLFYNNKFLKDFLPDSKHFGLKFLAAFGVIVGLFIISYF